MAGASPGAARAGAGPDMASSTARPRPSTSAIARAAHEFRSLLTRPPITLVIFLWPGAGRWRLARGPDRLAEADLFAARGGVDHDPAGLHLDQGDPVAGLAALEPVGPAAVDGD